MILAPIFGDLRDRDLADTMCPKQSVAFSYIAQPEIPFTLSLSNFIYKIVPKSQNLNFLVILVRDLPHSVVHRATAGDPALPINDG